MSKTPKLVRAIGWELTIDDYLFFVNKNMKYVCGECNEFHSVRGRELITLDRKITHQCSECKTFNYFTKDGAVLAPTNQ